MVNNILAGCGVHHIALGVADLERSIHFYSQLGFTPVYSWKSGERTIAMIDLGDGSCLELFSDCTGQPNGEKTAGSFLHLALRVKDSAAAFDLALQAGAKPKSQPAAGQLSCEPPLPVVVSFVYGPDGEQIEFFETRG